MTPSGGSMRLLNLHSRYLVLFLLLLSLALYGVDYALVGKTEDVAISFLGNLAFLPVYVLFVTLVIERVLKERERMALRQKLNMVIGVFFSEVGTNLLRDCSGFIGNIGDIASRLRIVPRWSEKDFAEAHAFLEKFPIDINSRKGDLAALKEFLVAKREFMLGLLENPNLLEHNDFTDLLWAVFHLVEELDARQAVAGLPEADMDHLSGDMKRVYGHLLREWLVYIRHLQHDYPYLFSLAVRMNPLDPTSHPEVD